MRGKSVLRELLSRRDPSGYYVIPAEKSAIELLQQCYSNSIVVEDLGDILLVKVTSRSSAERIVNLLFSRGLLKNPR